MTPGGIGCAAPGLAAKRNAGALRAATGKLFSGYMSDDPNCIYVSSSRLTINALLTLFIRALSR